MVHASALEQFEKNDVELTVPASEPRPILIIVMVRVMCDFHAAGYATDSSRK